MSVLPPVWMYQTGWMRSSVMIIMHLIRMHICAAFGEGNSGEYLFLIDEAHNLVERARTMYSADLYKEDVLAVKKKVKNTAPKLGRSWKNAISSSLH